MAIGLSGIIELQIRQIKKEVGQIASSLARGVAKKAFDDMKQAHRLIIESYYAGYTPVAYYTYISPKTGFKHHAPGYKRTYQLYNSIIPMGVFSSGAQSFSAKIGVGPDGMSGYTNSMGLSFPASGVLNLVWDLGNRGLPPGYQGHVGLVEINASLQGISMTGSPDNAMQMFMDQWWDVIGQKYADGLAASLGLSVK